MRKALLSEINVVPYVDVMLVLLIIFMVTAPLLTQGVEVDLPSASAETLPQEEKPPVIVTLDAKGRLFIDSAKDPLDATALVTRLKATLQLDPKRTILVRGDKHIDYGQVMSIMVLLQQSGVSKVGLVTQHEEH